MTVPAFRGALLASIALVPAPLLAQEAIGGDNPVTTTTIVVTAQKIEQRAQDVPITISAVTGERIEDLEATVDHLKAAPPDRFLTTVAYPIKGTPYHDRVADRIVSTTSWLDGSDRRVAVSASIGAGVEFFTSSSMAIDGRAQYRLVFGSTRPMEAWGLAEAWPFSKIDLALRLKFYFLK